MTDIYVFGSGGFATEVYYLINEINIVKRTYNFKGFLDKNPNNNSIYIGNKMFPILDEDLFFKKNKDSSSISLAIGIGNPQIIKKIYDLYNNFSFPNIIHPSAHCSKKFVSFGNGNIVTSGVSFTINISIGNCNIFNLNSTIGHDCKIGDFNVINPGVNLSGDLCVSNQILIGTGSTVLQGLSIGSKSILGAGCVLTKDLEESKLAVGIPAKVIKNLNDG